MPLSLPRQLGHVAQHTPEVLAIRAVRALAECPAGRKQPIRYALSVDPRGRLVLDRLEETNPDEWRMTVTRASTAPEIAEELA